jgi:DHA3 family tetracycline resistance protein-like MFS transporter
MEGAHGLIFHTIVTVNLVYHVTVVGLNPLQLILVGTVLEASVLLLEIPTGVVADVYSRRLSIILGFLLMGAGFFLEGASPLFATVLLAQVIWGVGATFLSGATEAWIADELSQNGAEGELVLGRAFLRGAQFNQAGALLGIGLSVALASIYVTAPIITGGVLFIALALFLIRFMPEDGFSPTPRQEGTSWHAMGQTLQSGLQLVRVRPILPAILGITLILGLASEGFDRLWTAHILENFTLPALGGLAPIVWFGLIDAVAMVLSMGAAELARRTIDTTRQQTVVLVLIGLNAAIMIGIISFALTMHFSLALLAYWLSQALRTTRHPLYMAWINRQLESRVRATVLSLNGQADALGQIAGGPPVGIIGTIYSLRAALVVTGAILAPALALYARTLRQLPQPATPDDKLGTSGD